VDPELARFAAWYEFFPRSASPDPSRPGTLDDAADRLEAVRDLGFDVVYLPPIHPIGTTFRKGKDNSPTAEPGEPGSPWAIGAEEGGHKAVAPELGGMEAFERFVARADALGLKVALDIAYQTSPDHPYVKEHPEWFQHRADGTIRYAENPPKKYQDVYPLDFEGEGLAGPLARAQGRVRVLDLEGGPHLPGGQPPHQAVRVLGVVRRSRSGGSTRT
jgi:starch synthase (maltosyl-transferring)